ncbi:hypothetical protein L7F22_017233 [Adiantum nelumboides]|nr:hypothetical protein [Adiantum nelumboides]
MPSPLVEQPPSQDSLSVKANVWVGFVKHHLLLVYEELRRTFCPLLCAIFGSKKRPTTTEPLLHTGLPELIDDQPADRHSLEKYLEELKKKLAYLCAQLQAKIKESDSVKKPWQQEAEALKIKLEELIQKDRENEESFKEEAYALLDDLHKRIMVVERSCKEQLAQVQEKLREHRSAMSKLNEEALSSLAKVSQAISRFT